MHFQANSVIVQADLDYGEGWIQFVWKDTQNRTESLRIDLDRHCSKSMPWYSGTGVEVICLERTSMLLRFPPTVAESLRFEKEVQISFTLNDAEYVEVRRFVEFLEGHD
jgi:hypothetical protein